MANNIIKIISVDFGAGAVEYDEQPLGVSSNATNFQLRFDSHILGDLPAKGQAVKVLYDDDTERTGVVEGTLKSSTVKPSMNASDAYDELIVVVQLD